MAKYGDKDHFGQKKERVKGVNQHIQQEYKPLPLLW